MLRTLFISVFPTPVCAPSISTTQRKALGTWALGLDLLPLNYVSGGRLHHRSAPQFLYHRMKRIEMKEGGKNEGKEGKKKKK